mgnify:CR=1 FL=1
MEVIIKKSVMIDEAACDHIDAAGIKALKVFSSIYILNQLTLLLPVNLNRLTLNFVKYFLNNRFPI